MNSCILMAQIVRSPELRYTQDNQTPVAQMLVEFLSGKPDEPPATLKVVGWGNFATEIKENYKEGDRVILEGRLNMNTFERPEGFKEKRAELTVSRIYRLDSSLSSSSVASGSSSDNVIAFDSYKGNATEPVVAQEVPPKASVTKVPPVSNDTAIPEQDLDDIPF
jgi:single-strand DNA-binding protein